MHCSVVPFNETVGAFITSRSPVYLSLASGSFKSFFDNHASSSVSNSSLLSGEEGSSASANKQSGRAFSVVDLVLKGSNGLRISESTRSHKGIARSSNLGMADSNAACFCGWMLLIYGERRVTVPFSATTKSEGSHWNCSEKVYV